MVRTTLCLSILSDPYTKRSVGAILWPLITESGADGSARAWGARGRRFEPCLSDKYRDFLEFVNTTHIFKSSVKISDMKLLSLNVALFEENNDKLAPFIQAQDADILTLQEVTKRVDSSAKSELISKEGIDSSSPDLTYSFFAPVWVLSKFEKNYFHGKDVFSFDLGGNVEFGNYTKSKFHITKGQNIFVQNYFSYVTDWSKWPEDDYRGFQVTDLLIDGKDLRVINYHGIWSKDKKGTDKTKRACETIRDFGLEAKGALVICGDFNLFPDTESIEVLNEQFKNLCNEYSILSTRPETNELSDLSRNVVDYLFVNDKVKVNHFEVLQSEVSDHLPLVMDFDLY